MKRHSALFHSRGWHWMSTVARLKEPDLVRAGLPEEDVRLVLHAVLDVRQQFMKDFMGRARSVKAVD